MSYRLLSYKSGKDARAGILVGEAVHDVAKVTGKAAWSSVLALLQEWPAAHKALNAVADKLESGKIRAKGVPLNSSEIRFRTRRRAPTPPPPPPPRPPPRPLPPPLPPPRSPWK